MTPSIFLVVGITGRWTDNRDWIVCYKHTREDAEAIRDLCQRQADGYRAWCRDDCVRNQSADAARRKLVMFDVFFECDEGTRYEVVEVCGDPLEHPSASSYQRMHLETVQRLADKTEEA